MPSLEAGLRPGLDLGAAFYEIKGCLVIREGLYDGHQPASCLACFFSRHEAHAKLLVH
jgi:hypothetical protein